MSVRGGKADPDTWACLKAQPPRVPEAGSQHALSHLRLPFGSLQLGSVFPRLWCSLSGEDGIKTEAGGSAPVWLLLALCACLLTLKGPVWGHRMQLLLEKGEGGLFLEHCFSEEGSRPYSTTISLGP